MNLKVVDETRHFVRFFLIVRQNSSIVVIIQIIWKKGARGCIYNVNIFQFSGFFSILSLQIKNKNSSLYPKIYICNRLWMFYMWQSLFVTTFDLGNKIYTW